MFAPRLDREGIGFDHAMESGTESDANVAVVRTVIDVCPLFANRQATPLRGLSLCRVGVDVRVRAVRVVVFFQKQHTVIVQPV